MSQMPPGPQGPQGPQPGRPHPTPVHQPPPHMHGAPQGPPPPQQVPRRPRSQGGGIMDMFKPFAWPCLLVGLLLVMSARGCSSLTMHGISVKQADYQIERNKDREENDRGRGEESKTLKRLRKEAANARFDAAGTFWMAELLFQIGGIVLVFGLICLGATAVGPERWLAMVMLGIITFSLFVANVSSLMSIVSMSNIR